MKRTALLAALVAVLVAPQTFAAGGGWHKTVAAAQKAAKEKNQLIFVDMFAQWCGWCHRFDQEVAPSQAFQTVTKDMVLLRVDTEDRGEGTQLAQRFAITSLPTFVLLTPDMTLAGIIKGYAPPNEFANMVRETRAKHDKFLDMVKSEATFAKDFQKRLDLAREFNSRSAYAQSESRLKKLVTEKGVPATIRDAAYYDLAVSYLLQKKYNDSMQTVQKLTSLSKSGEPVERARLLAAQIHMEQGNLVRARDEFAAFKKSFPNSQFNRNIDMMLPDLERRIQLQKAVSKQ